MIPRTLHFVWIGGEILPLSYENMATFAAMNPGFAIYIWDELSIEDRLGLSVKQLRDLFPTPAGASNAVRLKALFQFGGFYFDMDFLCHAPLDPLRDHRAVAAFQDEGRICNAFMGAEAGHPWIAWQLARMEDWEGHGPEWGVYNATNAPRDGLTIIPTEQIYPYHYTTPLEDRAIKPGTLAEHQWEGSWVTKEEKL